MYNIINNNTNTLDYIVTFIEIIILINKTNDYWKNE